MSTYSSRYEPELLSFRRQHPVADSLAYQSAIVEILCVRQNETGRRPHREFLAAGPFSFPGDPRCPVNPTRQRRYRLVDEAGYESLAKVLYS
jgi:hypothetical protein